MKIQNFFRANWRPGKRINDENDEKNPLTHIDVICSHLGKKWGHYFHNSAPQLTFNKIPRRSVAHIWLPKILKLQFMHLQNLRVPMEDWAEMKEEESQVDNQSFLDQINRELPEALKRRIMRSGISIAEMKLFCSVRRSDEYLWALYLNRVCQG